MASPSYTDSAYKTFAEETPGQLTGKEGYLVELTATGTVQLLTTGKAIGAVATKLQGSTDVTVRLLGKGGTVRLVQGGAITCGTRLKGASGGKVVSAGTTGDRSVGIKASPGTTGADLDVIEVIDVVETV